MGAFLIQALIAAGGAMLKPMISALISAFFTPKFIVGILLDAGDIIVKKTPTHFDDDHYAEFKALVMAYLDKAQAGEEVLTKPIDPSTLPPAPPAAPQA